MREIAQSIGRHLGLPVDSVPGDRLEAHFGFLTMLAGWTSRCPAGRDAGTLGWEPAHPGLLDDLDNAALLRRAPGDQLTAGPGAASVALRATPKAIGLRRGVTGFGQSWVRQTRSRV